MHAWLQPAVVYDIACFAGFCVSDAITFLDALPPTTRHDVFGILYARIQATANPSELLRVIAIESVVVDTTIELQLVQPTTPWPVTVAVDWIPRWAGSAVLEFWPCTVTSLQISLPSSLAKTEKLLAGIAECINVHSVHVVHSKLTQDQLDAIMATATSSWWFLQSFTLTTIKKRTRTLNSSGSVCMWLASSPVQSLTFDKIDFERPAARALAGVLSHSTTLKSLVLYDKPTSWSGHSQLATALSDATAPPLPPQLTSLALHLASWSTAEVAAWGAKVAASQLSTLKLDLNVPRDVTALVCNALQLPTLANLILRCGVLKVLPGIKVSSLRSLHLVGCSLSGDALATVVEIFKTSEVLEDVQFKYTSIPPPCVAAIAAALPAWTSRRGAQLTIAGDLQSDQALEFVRALPCVRNSSRFSLRLRETNLAKRERKHLISAPSQCRDVLLEMDAADGMSDAADTDVAAYARHVGVLMVDATTFYAPPTQPVSKNRQCDDPM
ncbi:hypothetical protein SDRG_02163 [Saprolegnia diclina VS20]|uniref:F-box domain-containing protein n=1 Tax=Saprolegnia diclina (strain VS20) TaxID=1156394 RepID=T0QSI6_SAPDV|nr:hypothetical protein SDRG_02163 [Saprolegnia diclina VS20]EQC41114.1 hypothetical protein SDRG_02163 [Saprolegnia diclina VS20]|eukprot:XP_008605958.1 hypothetical protein SDRG_02163 [Saprolegnia diclina VS20]